MFTKNDVNLARGLKELINKAEFPLKARELQATALIIGWARELEGRFSEHIKPKPEKKEKKKSGRNKSRSS